MSLSRMRKPTLIVLSLLLALAVLGLAPQPAAPASEGNAIALKAPSFVQVASAQEDTTAQDAPAAAPMGFPQDEAGISAYFRSASPVNLADVRGVYRVIEVETADYIIGSVPVPDYSEDQDTHVYVHRDGWFVAYYLQVDPVGKIFDWKRYTPTTIPTKLERVLIVAATQAGVSMPQLNYYDFRYPNATHMMFIAEVQTGSGTDSFEINLPGTYNYYHRSWSFSAGNACYYSFARLRLDSVEISVMDCGRFTSGSFTAAQLTLDTFHTFLVDTGGGQDGYAGLALLYRAPQ